MSTADAGPVPAGAGPVPAGRGPEPAGASPVPAGRGLEPAGAGPEPAGPVVVSFAALGTTARVVVAGGGRVEAACDAVRAELAAIDKACSRFRPDSELMRLNAAAGGAVPVSSLLLEAVLVALRAARLTGGLVDPTMGRAMRTLGYDRDFRLVGSVTTGAPTAGSASGGDVTARQAHPAGWVARNRPQAERHRPVLTLIPGARTWEAIRVDRIQRTISVPEGVELDLGATAKALAADRAAVAALRLVGGGVLVSLGGDIAVAGEPPKGGWAVRVSDDHAASGDDPGQTIIIDGGGLATSGTTVRHWRRDGRDLHHLLDPATQRPAAVVWRTVSVAAGSCVDANTASTAAIVMGRGAPGWLAANGLPARLVARHGAVVTVGDWPRAA